MLVAWQGTRQEREYVLFISLSLISGYKIFLSHAEKNAGRDERKHQLCKELLRVSIFIALQYPAISDRLLNIQGPFFALFYFLVLHAHK